MKYTRKETVSHFALLLAAFAFVASVSTSWSAEKVAPRSFKNVAEIIGWVKAKGKCEILGGTMETCKVEVELPTNKDGKQLSPGWTLKGSFDTTVLENFIKALNIAIGRGRKFSLSAKDKTAVVGVAKVVNYELGSDGKIVGASATITLTNYKNEKFLTMEIPLPHPYYIAGVDRNESRENLSLIYDGFGLQWSPYPERKLTGTTTGEKIFQELMRRKWNRS